MPTIEIEPIPAILHQLPRLHDEGPRGSKAASARLRELEYLEVARPTLGFRAVNLGVHEKWAIVRTADNVQVAKNIPSFDEAMRITESSLFRTTADAIRRTNNFGRRVHARRTKSKG